MALDRPFDDGRVQTANAAVSAASVRKYNGLFNLYVQGKTTFISPTFQDKVNTTETGVSDAREEEDSRASHKRRQTS